MSRTSVPLAWIVGLLIAALAPALQGATPVAAPSAPANAVPRDPDALAALDRMGAALRALTHFSVVSQTSTEVVLEDGQKVELDGVVTYRVKAPDMLFLELKSDRQLREIYFNGSSLALYAPRLNYYAQSDGLKATLSELVDDAYTRFGIDMPLADMFLWGTEKAPKTAIRSALHIGGGTVDGEAVEQYAFKQDDLDWQVWISRGTSLPKKLVITSLDDPALPQYRARLQWDTRSTLADSTFRFNPPADAARIKLVPAVALVAADPEEN